MNQLNELNTFPVPLSFSAHARAEKMRQQQSTPPQAKQAYLNALAVYAVDFYLHCLGIATEIERSDSQNPLHAKFMNVADLQVKSIGKLECRPVLPGATVLEIPAEVRFPAGAEAERVAYLAVQFDRSLKQAMILGFTPTATATIPLQQLQPITDLPDYLQQLRSASTDLGQWLNNCFEVGWQELSDILSPERLRLAFRSAHPAHLRERGKLIQLSTPNQTATIILVVELNSVSTSDLNVKVTVLSEGERSYLPTNLQVQILDAQKTAVMQAIVSQKNQNMEFDFHANFGERFSVQISLDETLVHESFAI
jgi:hypothetical protein